MEVRHRVKKTVEMTVLSNVRIADGVYSLALTAPAGTFDSVCPGQFVGVYPSDPSRLLPRPISICRFTEQQGTQRIRLVYRTAGAGTLEFSRLKEGQTIRVLGILGNGYDLEQLSGRNVLLLGGGIGAPPLLELAARLHATDSRTKITIGLGYRTDDLFLKEEFEQYGIVRIATDDGSAGTHGTVLDAVRNAQLQTDVICACGPMPMLRGVKAYSEELQIPAYISLEERMACGVGVCLGCVVKTTRISTHSWVKNTRICTEGPVFNAEEVLI